MSTSSLAQNFYSVTNITQWALETLAVKPKNFTKSPNIKFPRYYSSSKLCMWYIFKKKIFEKYDQSHHLQILYIFEVLLLLPFGTESIFEWNWIVYAALQNPIVVLKALQKLTNRAEPNEIRKAFSRPEWMSGTHLTGLYPR